MRGYSWPCPDWGDGQRSCHLYSRSRRQMTGPCPVNHGPAGQVWDLSGPVLRSGARGSGSLGRFCHSLVSLILNRQLKVQLIDLERRVMAGSAPAGTVNNPS